VLAVSAPDKKGVVNGLKKSPVWNLSPPSRLVRRRCHLVSVFSDLNSSAVCTTHTKIDAPTEVSSSENSKLSKVFILNNSGYGQNIAVYVSPTDRNCAFLNFAFLVQSSLLFVFIFLKSSST